MAPGDKGNNRDDSVIVELQRRTAELELLCETIRDLGSTLSVPEVIAQLLDRTLVHFDAEIGSVLQLDFDGALHIVCSRGLPDEVVMQSRLQQGEGISGFVLSSGEPLLIDDIETDKRFGRQNHERYYTSSCISAPLLVDSEPRGVINVNNKRSHERFDADDLALLEAIAGHAATALHNAGRFEDVLTQARCDGLTGLANHGHFWASLETEFSRSQRHGRPLSVAMIDIDHFKAYNDEFGHLEGDRTLVAVAAALVSNSRSHDLVARYGGEEFSVILPETTREGAVHFAEKTRELLESSSLGSNDEADITISVGVASYPDDGSSASDVVSRADDRLYRAKSDGRNRVYGDGGR